MKKQINSLIKICMLSLIPISAVGQATGSRNITITLPKVALLDVEPAGTVVMDFLAPTEAGRPLVAPAVNNSKWINYTSALATADPSRSITAAINQTIPGLDLRLQAAAASGSGGGTRGTAGGQVVLTTVPTTIISGIRGAFTGTGANNGHRLTLSIRTNNYANLTAGNNNTLVITYTIIE
ncbi:MAG TPA: hypothetical protein VKZ57_07155 [Sphingobacterium sp.]|nr:hypothetical protein [Sphingobacterium sp.]